MLEKLFGLTKAKTTVKTEIMAGVATFLTMAYITVVNPAILSKIGLMVCPLACRERSTSG